MSVSISLAGLGSLPLNSGGRAVYSVSVVTFWGIDVGAGLICASASAGGAPSWPFEVTCALLRF